MAKSKGKRVPVMVDESVYNEFKNYSNQSGAPISYLIREALTEWADTVLAARSESLGKTTAKVVCIDRAGITQAVDTELAELMFASETQTPA